MSRPKKTLAKRYYRVAQALMKNILLVFVAGKNDSMVIAWNRKHRREEPVGMALAGAIADGIYPWVIHCAVTGRRQDGQQYMKLEYLASPHPTMQSQISASCNELHKSMLAEFNKVHQLTAAWVASPRGEELDPAEVDGIITSAGAYDFFAQWEDAK